MGNENTGICTYNMMEIFGFLNKIYSLGPNNQFCKLPYIMHCENSARCGNLAIDTNSFWQMSQFLMANESIPYGR